MFYPNSSTDSLSSDLKVFSEADSEFVDSNSERRIPTKVRITILDDEYYDIDDINVSRNQINNSNCSRDGTVPANDENNIELLNSSSSASTVENSKNDDDIVHRRESTGEENTSSNKHYQQEDIHSTPTSRRTSSFSKITTTTPLSPIVNYYRTNKILLAREAPDNENMDDQKSTKYESQHSSKSKTYSHTKELSYSTIEKHVHPKTRAWDFSDDIYYTNSTNQRSENENSQFSKVQQEKKLKRKQQRFSLNNPINPGFSKMLSMSRDLSKESYESKLNDILNFEIIESPAVVAKADTTILNSNSNNHDRLQHSGSFSKFKSKFSKRFSSSNDISKYNFPKDDLGIITNSAY